MVCTKISQCGRGRLLQAIQLLKIRESTKMAMQVEPVSNPEAPKTARMALQTSQSAIRKPSSLQSWKTAHQADLFTPRSSPYYAVSMWYFKTLTAPV
jgi:hypothetical protein